MFLSAPVRGTRSCRGKNILGIPIRLLHYGVLFVDVDLPQLLGGVPRDTYVVLGVEDVHDECHRLLHHYPVLPVGGEAEGGVC